MGPADTLASLILAWLAFLLFVGCVSVLFVTIYRALGRLAAIRWQIPEITRTKE